MLVGLVQHTAFNIAVSQQTNKSFVALTHNSVNAGLSLPPPPSGGGRPSCGGGVFFADVRFRGVISLVGGVSGGGHPLVGGGPTL